jgi:dienelactone hydrolase
VPHEDVTLSTSNDLELAGWYIPSKNGAAVLLVHGGGGSREGVAPHAAMLARNGYGVLLYDARGRGESEGRTDGYGWTWGKDISAALTYLERRPDVAPNRIGALGVSTGADVLIEATAEGADIKALVADGATARSFPDARELVGVDALPYWWGVFTAVKVFTGAAPGRPLEELVPRIAPTPLFLISADWGIERKANRRYARAAGESTQHWQLPAGTGHTHGLRDLGRRYERRVEAFFDDALLETGGN